MAEGSLEGSIGSQPDFGLVYIVCKYRHSYRAIEGIEFDLVVKIKCSQTDYMVPFLKTLNMFSSGGGS